MDWKIMRMVNEVRVKMGWGLIAAAFSISNLGLGYGLVVPGGQDGPNDYYAIRDGKLYRYFCPKGSEANETDCKIDTTFLYRYDDVAARIEADINLGVKENRQHVMAEKNRIVNTHPKVSALRASIDSAKTKIDALKIERNDLKLQRETVALKLERVKKQIDHVTQELLKPDLDNSEFGLLVEQRRQLTERAAGYEKEVAALSVSIKQKDAEIEKQSLVVIEKSQEIADLIPTIALDSEELRKLIATRNLLEAQIERLPELGKRIKQEFAYDLSDWISTGAVGVKELSDRFLLQVGCKPLAVRK